MRFKSREQQAAVMMQYAGSYTRKNRRFAVRKSRSTVRTGKVTTSKVNRKKQVALLRHYRSPTYDPEKGGGHGQGWWDDWEGHSLAANRTQMKERGIYDKYLDKLKEIGHGQGVSPNMELMVGNHLLNEDKKKKNEYDPRKDPNSQLNRTGNPTKEEKRWIAYHEAKELGIDPGASPYKPKEFDPTKYPEPVKPPETKPVKPPETKPVKPPETKPVGPAPPIKIYPTVHSVDVTQDASINLKGAYRIAEDKGLIPILSEKERFTLGSHARKKVSPLENIYKREDFSSDGEYQSFLTNPMHYCIQRGLNAELPPSKAIYRSHGKEGDRGKATQDYVDKSRLYPKFVPYHFPSIVKPDGEEIFGNFGHSSSATAIHDAHRLRKLFAFQGKYEDEITYPEAYEGLSKIKARSYKLVNTDFYSLRDLKYKSQSERRDYINKHAVHYTELNARPADAAEFVGNTLRHKIKFGEKSRRHKFDSSNYENIDQIDD